MGGTSNIRWSEHRQIPLTCKGAGVQGAQDTRQAASYYLHFISIGPVSITLSIGRLDARNRLLPRAPLSCILLERLVDQLAIRIKARKTLGRGDVRRPAAEALALHGLEELLEVLRLGVLLRAILVLVPSCGQLAKSDGEGWQGGAQTHVSNMQTSVPPPSTRSVAMYRSVKSSWPCTAEERSRMSSLICGRMVGQFWAEARCYERRGGEEERPYPVQLIRLRVDDGEDVDFGHGCCCCCLRVSLILKRRWAMGDCRSVRFSEGRSRSRYPGR